MMILLSECWALNDPLPKKVEAIGLLSYAAQLGEKELTIGSWRTLGKATDFMNRYPEAILYWGVFSENAESVRVEESQKSKILTGLFPGRHKFVGKVSSTTDECEAILVASGNVRSFLVISEGWHSRRARLVWKHFFKGELCFQSIAGRLCVDPKNPLILQRYSAVWMFFNLVFTPLYKFFPGVAWFAKRNFHQISS